MRTLLAATLAGFAILASPANAQTITVVNGAGVNPQTVLRLENALTVQVNRDLKPVWHTPSINFGPNGWRLILTNGKQVDGLGGFHAAAAGQPPFATVYVKANGDSWSILASHELMEMLVDPAQDRYINWKLVEISDPVYFVYYHIQGVQVSDFVTPAWFYPHSRGPWDFEGSLN